jgi:small subunit ribosomal protein S17
MARKKEAECNDAHCPVHAGFGTLGAILEGTVASDKRKSTATVTIPFIRYIPEYERYEKKRKKIAAHNPPCISARKGDSVKIAECRPISKTVSFVIVKKG